MKQRMPVMAQRRPLHSGPAARGHVHLDASTERLLRRPEVLLRTGLSRTSMYRLMQQQQFPRPVHLSAKTVAWSSSAIDAWIAARIAARAIAPED